MMNRIPSGELPLSQYFPDVSRLAFGCMGLGGSWDDTPINADIVQQAHNAIDAALEGGINFFDHADIYTLGKAELVFGQVLRERPKLRDMIQIQSKCGIRFGDEHPKRYDLSGEWISKSVEGILTRLGIEQLDIFLLHRPDPLMEPEIVAAVFERLHQEGKVAHFGVSNMQHHQIAFLQSYLSRPLVVNQVDISLGQQDWLEEGVMVGNPAGHKINFTSGTLEYCRTSGVQIQSWGSLAQGRYSGRDISDAPDTVKNTAALVQEMAGKYEVSREAIVLAWLMRHPAAVQPVIGTTNEKRIQACAQAIDITLTREDWYRLYESSRGNELP